MAHVQDIKLNPPTNRLVGDMPKVGIRPTIDGRLGGVRESLEDQTMAMAQSVAKLISENLRHANGLPVECVIADTTIGRVAEAAGLPLVTYLWDCPHCHSTVSSTSKKSLGD